MSCSLPTGGCWGLQCQRGRRHGLAVHEPHPRVRHPRGRGALPPDDIEGPAFLRQADIPLASTSSLDLTMCGGFTEAEVISQMAAARNLRVSPHCWGTGVCLAAPVMPGWVSRSTKRRFARCHCPASGAPAGCERGPPVGIRPPRHGGGQATVSVGPVASARASPAPSRGVP
ncbi:enolase C-terminal domain-like protein [Streptomyces viridochromogenes]|uniref:enolase C-terminal domain-like protein n=1 Tax=Streptomyces viridochromogenes TaxID=1938 RepID=UPI003CC7E66B